MLYTPHIMLLWQSNMDIHFIESMFITAAFVIFHITNAKSEGIQEG